MNVKLHTPKSLKMGSGMGSLKQFLLSLFATTVSIALTFGTAAIIDNSKKQSEKREIVMMLMYDVYNSLKSIEKADSLIRYSIEVQRQIAADTTQFNTLKFKLSPTFTLQWSDYTETTEHIFSSSIETINTIGNVLFTENVARLYQFRGLYKSLVCDSIASTLNQNNPIYSVKRTLDIPYSFYALLSHELLTDMQQRYALCKQLMDVTDEEIEVYRKEREALEGSLADDKATLDAVAKEISQLQTEIDTLKAKLKLEDN